MKIVVFANTKRSDKKELKKKCAICERAVFITGRGRGNMEKKLKKYPLKNNIYFCQDCLASLNWGFLKIIFKEDK